MKRKPKRMVTAATLPTVDATDPLDVRARRRHFKLAIEGDGAHCPVALAAMEKKEVQDFILHRHFAYVLFVGDTVLTRFQSPTVAYEFLKAFDKRHINSVPLEGIVFTFKVPRWKVSLKYLRSAEFKRRRQASYRNTKNKKIKRPYRLKDPMTLAGVRVHYGYVETT